MSSPVFFFEGDDPDMIQACLAAQASFKYFWRELSWERRHIVPGLDMAMIKLPFDDGPGSQPEHMWLGDVDFDGETLSGTLLNDPNWLESITPGDKVSAPFGRLEDWMITADGKAYGAHTVHCLRAKMGAAERVNHDQAWGLDFGDPARVRLHLSAGKTGETAETRKPGFMARLFSKTEAPPSPAIPSGHQDHPMCINMLPKAAIGCSPLFGR